MSFLRGYGTAQTSAPLRNPGNPSSSSVLRDAARSDLQRLAPSTNRPDASVLGMSSVSVSSWQFTNRVSTTSNAIDSGSNWAYLNDLGNNIVVSKEADDALHRQFEVAAKGRSDCNLYAFIAAQMPG